MNAVENIESLVKRYFNEDIRIKDKSVTNNCIGALISKDNFKEFKKNFEDRLERLVGKITEKSQRKEVIEKIKNLAEKNGRKWAGAYSELVALDFFLNSYYIEKFQFVNKCNTSEDTNSLAARNNKKTIDIDISFNFRGKKYFTDVKSLVPTQEEVLDSVIENVAKRVPDKKILIGVDDLRPESLIDFQAVIDDERKNIEEALAAGIKASESRVTYKTKNGSDYVFNIGYTGTLSTMCSKNPYELAEKDKYKYLNYYSKLLDIDYSVLTFVVNPWFNRQITNFCDFNRVYYRSVSRRVFMEFKNDATPAALYFRDIKNKAITVSDISTNIAGLLFIEDKSVKRDTDGILYKAYLYLNPNYANKKPLTVYDFSSAFEHSPISKMFEIDDFQHDNY